MGFFSDLFSGGNNKQGAVVGGVIDSASGFVPGVNAVTNLLALFFNKNKSQAQPNYTPPPPSTGFVQPMFVAIGGAVLLLIGFFVFKKR